MDKLREIHGAMPTEANTRSPYLNAVIAEAERILDGKGNMEALREKVGVLEQVVHQMIQVYNHESKYQEKTDLFLREAEIIENGFKELQQGILQIKKFYTTGDTEDLEEGIGICMVAFERLFESFDRLKEEEMKREVYSSSPYMNEVMRVADCVLRGTLPPDALKDRITDLIKLEKQFYENFDQIKPSEAERIIFEENREKMKNALKGMIDGLYEALQYFKDFSPETLEKALEKANEHAEFLVEMEQKLKEAREAPKVKYCPKCGAENPATVKFCVNCNFRFPPLHLSDESTVDIRLEEGGIRQTGHVMTENMLKIVNAVEGIKKKEITIEAYKEVLDWFKGLLEHTKREAEKIKEPDESEDPEAIEVFRTFKNTFYEGIADLEEGLEKLYNFIDTHNYSLLETGLELMMSGGDRLVQVHLASEQLKANVPNMSK